MKKTIAACTVAIHSLNELKNKDPKLKITSITIEKSAINDILENNEKYKDKEEIFVFEIIGVISYTDYTWNVYKNYKQINLLFDVIQNCASKQEIRDEDIINKCKQYKKYTSEEITKKIKNIVDFLIYVFKNIEQKELKEEFQISQASFVDESGIKPFEGYAMKKADGLFGSWEKKWIILKNDMISYYNDPNELKGENVFWLDDHIELIKEKEQTLIIKDITNPSKNITLKFESIFERDLWKKQIEIRMEQKVDEIICNEYHSFTSQKMNCGAKWFVDGFEYFSYLFGQLKRAKNTVYITDWFMSPELALSRPICYDNYRNDDYRKKLNFSNVQRLMDLLYLLAVKGVKIYILLFCEMTVALATNSLHTKKTLNNLHPNIKVTRHPKGTTSILWSHHEKLVVIDNQVAFVGGIDLCWGRFDINQHPIVEKENEAHLYLYPGSDYINERQVDLHETENFYKEQIDRNKFPRMGWHDIHTMVQGPIANDIARHFVERWNYSRINKGSHKLVNVKAIEDTKSKETIKKEIQNKNFKSFPSDSNILFERPLQTLKGNELKFINKLVENKQKGKVDNDEGENIIKTIHSRISFDNLENPSNVEDYLYSKKEKTNQITIYNQYGKKESIDMNFKIQALRSVSYWSIGKAITERSILEAYYKLIDNAKHYIYIENQFFITKPFSEKERNNSDLNLNNLVKNEIGLHIRERIIRAYKEKTNFKVFICIPLLPGFSGTPGESSTVNCILKHTYQSIARNKGMSLLELLRKKMGDDINKYIYFFSLRNHGVINNKPVTELIYVHSKLLIVDDEKVLIGSANINDRSMKGSRDSEFAVIMEEEKNYESTMDGKKFIASKYALTLRKQLMAEHFGREIGDKILDDPLNEELWNEMITRAQVNTLIYRDIFNCFPDNEINTFANFKKRKIKNDEELKKEYDSKIIGIIGHIVEYPIDFLKDEQLDIDFFSKENIIPEKSYT